MRGIGYLARRKPTMVDGFSEHLQINPEHMENGKTGKEIKDF